MKWWRRKGTSAKKFIEDKNWNKNKRTKKTKERETWCLRPINQYGYIRAKRERERERERERLTLFSLKPDSLAEESHIGKEEKVV